MGAGASQPGPNRRAVRAVGGPGHRRSARHHLPPLRDRLAREGLEGELPGLPAPELRDRDGPALPRHLLAARGVRQRTTGRLGRGAPGQGNPSRARAGGDRRPPAGAAGGLVRQLEGREAPDRGRDHQGPDPPRRRDVPHDRPTGGPGHRRDVDGRLRRAPPGDEAPSPLRCHLVRGPRDPAGPEGRAQGEDVRHLRRRRGLLRRERSLGPGAGERDRTAAGMRDPSPRGRRRCPPPLRDHRLPRAAHRARHPPPVVGGQGCRPRLQGHRRRPGGRGLRLLAPGVRPSSRAVPGRPVRGAPARRRDDRHRERARRPDVARPVPALLEPVGRGGARRDHLDLDEGAGPARRHPLGPRRLREGAAEPAEARPRLPHGGGAAGRGGARDSRPTGWRPWARGRRRPGPS